MRTRFRELGFALTVFCLAGVSASGASYSILHTFGTLTNVVGLNPQSSLVRGPDGTLYGTTDANEGGIYGTVFKIQPDGSGFTLLKRFMNFGEGRHPQGTLLLDGNTLYGTLREGGNRGSGTVFSIQTDGTGFTNIYAFGNASEGSTPYGGLALSGNLLFGTTAGGGSAGNGTIFRVNTDGSGFTNLYSFSATISGTNSDGAYPESDLVLSGNWLFGTTFQGGSGQNGVIFRINTDGSGFTNLHSFSEQTGGMNSDGFQANARLAVAGNRLYGTAYAGGTNSDGTVFAINTDGSGFSVLHNFNYADDDGAYPTAGLVAFGNALYGTARQGGAPHRGVVFRLDVSGSDYTNLHAFNQTDGANPYAGMAISGGTLFGTTAYGGAADAGTIFRVNTDGAAFTNLFEFHYAGAEIPYGSMVEAGGVLYGTASAGGSGGAGVVFRVGTDGAGYTNLYSFNSFPYAGEPRGSLLLSGDTLYGTTRYGGSAYNGAAFQLGTDGSGFTNLHSFSYGNGYYPYSGVVMSGSNFFGTTPFGGSGQGGVYRMNTDGSDFTNLHLFNSTDGTTPYGRLVVSNGWLYGMAYAGGFPGNGTVFAMRTDGSDFAVLHAFAPLTSNTNSDGTQPYAGLALLGNRLYGTTYHGGAFGQGTLFAMNTDGLGFTNLHNFSFGAGNGANPYSALTIHAGKLYGTTVYGGDSGKGVVFTINADGSGYTNLYSFNGDDGANPYADVTVLGDMLYGTTTAGGEIGAGVVFALNLAAPPVVLRIQRIGNAAVLSWSDSAFSLQAAPSVTGSFTNVPGASSPYTNAADGVQRFFRLQSD